MQKCKGFFILKIITIYVVYVKLIVIFAKQITIIKNTRL